MHLKIIDSNGQCRGRPPNVSNNRDGPECGTRYAVRRLSSRGMSASERRAIPQGGISHETGQNLPVRLAGSSLETGIKTDGMSAGDLLFYSGVAELLERVNNE